MKTKKQEPRTRNTHNRRAKERQEDNREQEARGALRILEEAAQTPSGRPSQPARPRVVSSFAAPSTSQSRRAPLIESSGHLILDPTADVLSLTLPSSARTGCRSRLFVFLPWVLWVLLFLSCGSFPDERIAVVALFVCCSWVVVRRSVVTGFV